MNTDQIILFVLLLWVFAFLIWGRWRYDLVAFVALLIALVSGVVPSDQAFSGFGHPATAIIALVLVIVMIAIRSLLSSSRGDRVFASSRSAATPPSTRSLKKPPETQAPEPQPASISATHSMPPETPTEAPS